MVGMSEDKSTGDVVFQDLGPVAKSGLDYEWNDSPPANRWYREAVLVWINGIPSTMLITGKTSAEVAEEIREVWSKSL